MRRSTCLLAASVLVAGLFTVHGAAAAQGVSPACNGGTVANTELAGDDFAPDTPREPTWSYNPAGAFEPAYVEGGTGDGWRMRATEPGRASLTGRIDIPRGRQVMLVLQHEYALTPDARAWVDVGLPDGATDQVTFIEGEWNSRPAFSGTSALRISKADFGKYAGQSISLTLRAGQTAQIGSWDIHDLSILTCDGEQPSGPPSVGLTMGTGEATVSWTTPEWRPEEVDAYQVRVSELDGAVADRTFTAPAEARQFTVPQLAAGRTYRMSVSAGGPETQTAVFDSGVVAIKGRHNLKAIYHYGQSPSWSGSARRGSLPFRNDDRAQFDVQRRYVSTGSWVTFRSERATTEWTFGADPERNTQYRFVLRPGQVRSRGWTGYVSSTVSVRVSPYIDMYRVGMVEAGRAIRIKGDVAPVQPGKTVSLQRQLSSGAWRTERTARLNANGDFGFTFVKPAGGYVYRVAMAAGTKLDAGASDAQRITVRR